MDNSCSVIAAVVGWVLRRLCYEQPDSSVTDSSGHRSGSESFPEPKSGIGGIIAEEVNWRSIGDPRGK